MKRFVEGEDRRQGVLFPEYLDDWVSEENPVRAIDMFVDELDLGALGFEGAVPEATGRPGYHPGLTLKLYVYGYINQVASSRRLEREAQRNVELMWLTGRLAPDFKTIADFRKDNGPAIRAACRRFVELCRKVGLFAHAVAAIDGSRFKAVNTRDKNFTRASIQRRMEQVEASIARYLAMLETADRQEGELAEAKAGQLKRTRTAGPWPPTARGRGAGAGARPTRGWDHPGEGNPVPWPSPAAAPPPSCGETLGRRRERRRSSRCFRPGFGACSPDRSAGSRYP